MSRGEVMKVCLISAPTTNDFDDPEIAESDAIRTIAEHAPLGVLSLAAVLEQRGLQPEVVDLNRLYYDWLRSEDHGSGKKDFCGYVAAYFEASSFDFFGFSTICSSYPVTLRIAREVKYSHPNAFIALGGPQASVVDVQTMKNFPFIDCIVRGEAENTLPQLLDALSGDGPASVIAGITYRHGQELVRKPNATVVEDLDCLPFPAFHLYPYTRACEYIPLELGRGCPFACTFCSTNDFFRRRFRLKSPSHIIGEMKRIKDTYGISSFDLVHDMFTVDRKKVVAFCEGILDSGEEFYWGCSARTDCIDDELIALMAKTGCRGIFFGIETGSARLQKIIKKGLDLPEAAARIKFNDRCKIRTAVSLITGFPEETVDDLSDTINFFLDSLRYDYAEPQFCLLAPLAETPVQAEHRDSLIFDDIISDMSFQGWQQDPVDREMIAAYPDIFPNFYSVPTPHLDRQFLKELREFVLNGMTMFRWLLVGIYQDSGDFLEVFTHWRAWREKSRGPYPGGNPTMYYAGPSFHEDFLEFVRSDYLTSRAKAVVALSVLTDYESAFNGQESCAGGEEHDGEPGEDFGGLIGPDVTPVRARGVRITRLNADYGKIVLSLRRKGRLDRVRKSNVTLVTRETAEKRVEVLQLSPLSAELLFLCDDKRTVREVADEFSLGERLVNGVPAEKACILGLELLRRQGLLVIKNRANYVVPVDALTERQVSAVF
jgi:radical SAM superfamily enzyme YgiQ (UPF0313 family)